MLQLASRGDRRITTHPEVTITEAMRHINQPNGTIFIQYDAVDGNRIVQSVDKSQFDDLLPSTAILQIRPVRWTNTTLVAMVDYEFIGSSAETRCINRHGKSQTFDRKKIVDASLWPEYECHECGDNFPSRIPCLSVFPICASCRMGKRDGSREVACAPWPVYNCAGCHQRYPSKKPFHGNACKNKCISCRLKSAKGNLYQPSTSKYPVGQVLYLQDEGSWAGTDGYGPDGWQCSVLADYGNTVHVACMWDGLEYTKSKSKIVAAEGFSERVAANRTTTSSARFLNSYLCTYSTTTTKGRNNWKASRARDNGTTNGRSMNLIAPHCPHRAELHHTCSQHCVDQYEWEPAPTQALVGEFRSCAVMPEVRLSNTKRKKAVNALASMGYDRAVAAEMLELTTGNLDAAAELLLGQSQLQVEHQATWEEEIQILKELGFDDTSLNRDLLTNNGGNWKTCVKTLMTIERSQ